MKNGTYFLACHWNEKRVQCNELGQKFNVPKLFLPKKALNRYTTEVKMLPKSVF